MSDSRERLLILVISALPQEYAPLKKHFPSWRLERKEAPRKFALSLPGKEIILVESGMGDRAVREALAGELGARRPDLLLFSGFAGGLHPDLGVGAVCFADSARRIGAETVYTFRFSTELSDFLAENRIRPVLALSAETPGNKPILSALASGAQAVLDMETAPVAEVAYSHQIPFICFRAVSDAVDHDLGFTLEDICDQHGRVRPLGVFETIVKKPATLIAFYRLWRGSSLAARNLCASVAAFLNLPASELGRMAAEISVERG